MPVNMCLNRLTLVVASGAVLAACANPDWDRSQNRLAAHMTVGPWIHPPMGAVLFCEKHESECPEQPSQPHEVTMSPGRWNDLRAVQDAVNRRIDSASTAEIDWHYPHGRIGNCVQYALEKRRELITRGWPSGALLLATVVTPNRNRHLLLVIATTEGDWVLDNLVSGITRWNDLPYKWIARQQAASIRNWVSIRS